MIKMEFYVSGAYGLAALWLALSLIAVYTLRPFLKLNPADRTQREN